MPEAGSSIGPFRIERELGRGGMGVVYLARDTRLDRPVAIKALPEHLLDDPDRLARFQREAKTLAQLNHVNIAAIHGMEHHEGHHYLVLEYVEGPTLADRLEQGPLPLDDALDIAGQIAAGLEAAHDAGIIHRDLKPANIKITPGGKVKVLDFGLAKASENAGSSSAAHPVQTQSPTVTLRPVHSPTIPGAIMGTAPYMSPEQARGKAVDKRTDIWSFGVVLYEMLTGISPFHGETVSDSIGAILHRDVDLSQLPAGTPAPVRRVITRCLQRDKNLRYRDIGDAALDLRAADGTDPPPLAPRARERTRGLAVAVVTLVALAAAAGWLLAPRPLREAPRVIRFQIEAPKGYTLPSTEGGGAPLCVSPDGATIVFGAEAGGTRHLFAREVNAVTARLLPGTEGGAVPFFSPDGRWIAFASNGDLMKMPAAGGPPITIVEDEAGFGAWLDDDSIAFSNTRTIWTVDAAGGTPVALVTAAVESSSADSSLTVLGFNHLHHVLGAPYVLASTWNGDTIESYAIVAVSLVDGSMRLVLDNATGAYVVAPGYLAFLRESCVMAVPFDSERGIVTGDAVTIIDGVRASRWADSGSWAASPSGLLAFVPGGRIGPGRRLVTVDATGHAAPMLEGTDSFVGGVRVSPDGRFVAMTTLRKKVELWAVNIERRSLTLVTAEGETWQPMWMPDSATLIFTRKLISSGFDLVRKAIDAGASAPAETLPLDLDPGVYPYPYAVTPDGTTLLAELEAVGSATQRRIIAYPLASGAGRGGSAAGSGAPPLTPVAGLRANDYSVRLSPDGSLMAFASDESGRGEVYVGAFPGPGPRLQLSSAGGYAPCWSRDGKKVYFLDRTDVMHAVDITTEGGVRASPPTRLFDTAGIATTNVWGVFDTLPGGSFVMVQPAPWETEPARIQVVVNWQEELKAKLGPSRD